MSSLSVLRSAALTAGALLSLTACAPRDAADQDAVDLAPGEYHVTMAATVPGAIRQSVWHGPRTDDDRICVSDREAENFHERLVRRFLAFNSKRCSLKAADRQGNAVMGRLRCQIDLEHMSGGAFTASYHGVVSSDRIDMTSSVAIRLSDSMLANMDAAAAKEVRIGLREIEEIEIGITAERIGDCAAAPARRDWN
jgi:hypothetical protein